MEVFIIATFLVSLFGIVALFLLKRLEENRGAIFLPALRANADQGALVCKSLLLQGQGELKKLRPAVVRLSRSVLHDSALGFAAFLRTCEQKAHAFADFVSHKRNFERKESTNEFLRKVGSRKIGRLKEKDASVPQIEENTQN
jgi:hypothetical protein